jgi:hypothetical protein
MTTTQTDQARALAILSAPAWRPESGDLITGSIVGFRSYEHPEYGKSPVVVLDTKDGFRSVYLIHQTLLTNLTELAPQAGETITIAYQGKVESNKRKRTDGSPQDYHAYAVTKGSEIKGADEVAPW